MTNSRRWLKAPLTNPTLYRKCLDGHEPAEALPTYDRHRLVLTLYNRGWTDVQIAVHTRMTTYTTARIRGLIGVKPNAAWKGVA